MTNRQASVDQPAGIPGKTMVQPTPNSTVLAFMAHPDDAEILCGGTLIRLAELGWQVHIATATAGDCGTTRHSPSAIMDIRRAEAEAAARSIGATYHCLGELDGLVVYDKGTLRKTIDLFRQVVPSVLFTHAPRDYMMDHEKTSQLARGASFIYGAPNASSLRLLEGSGIPYLYYCDPVEGIGPLGEAVMPTTFVDISAVMDRKVRMLACHASQREWLRAHHGMDEYVESMKRQGQLRGSQAGCAYAEAFVQHRGHAYPSDDLLARLLSGQGTHGR